MLLHMCVYMYMCVRVYIYTHTHLMSVLLQLYQRFLD